MGVIYYYKGGLMIMLKENSIGFKIRSMREEKGLSQTELVEKLAIKENINISRETLSKIENDNRTISAIELNAICSILGVDLSVVFGDDNECDDLVTLFRKKGRFSDNIINEIEELQEMIKIFINQERIYKEEFKPEKRRPLWEEF